MIWFGAVVIILFAAAIYASDPESTQGCLRCARQKKCAKQLQSKEASRG